MEGTACKASRSQGALLPDRLAQVGWRRGWQGEQAQSQVLQPAGCTWPGWHVAGGTSLILEGEGLVAHWPHSSSKLRLLLRTVGPEIG